MVVDTLLGLVLVMVMIQFEALAQDYGRELKRFVVDRLSIREDPSTAFRTRICNNPRRRQFALKFACTKEFHWYQGGGWESVCLALFEGRAKYPPRRYRMRLVCGWKQLPLVNIPWEIKR